MSKTSKPFLAHSELTDCIYIIDGNDKYEVTEQCIKAMKATNRMPNVLDKIRAEFISLYPKNYAGELELGGSSCEFSLNKVLNVIDKYKAESEE